MKRTITSTSLFLMKEGFMRKAVKSELVKEFKENDLSYQMITESVDKYNKKITIIDFMAYARRLDSRIKKFNLKSYNDAMQNLWENFWKLGSHSDQSDIVFDLYKPDSVKASERKRRASDDAQTCQHLKNVLRDIVKMVHFHCIFLRPHRGWGRWENILNLAHAETLGMAPSRR